MSPLVFINFHSFVSKLYSRTSPKHSLSFNALLYFCSPPKDLVFKTITN